MKIKRQTHFCQEREREIKARELAGGSGGRAAGLTSEATKMLREKAAKGSRVALKNLIELEGRAIYQK